MPVHEILSYIAVVLIALGVAVSVWASAVLVRRATARSAEKEDEVHAAIVHESSQAREAIVKEVGVMYERVLSHESRLDRKRETLDALELRLAREEAESEERDKRLREWADEQEQLILLVRDDLRLRGSRD